MIMMMMMRAAMLMLVCFWTINAQTTTDLVVDQMCTQKNQDFLQLLLSPQQQQIRLAVCIVKDTSRQVQQVANTSQTLQRGLDEVTSILRKESTLEDTYRQVANTSQMLQQGLAEIKELLSTQQLLKQMKESIDNISAHITTTNQQSAPPAAGPSGDVRQQLVSALTERCIPLLIQQNINGSNFFNRSWEEFKVGFNDTNGNYWLGNELLSQLTMTGRGYKLRFDLQSRTNPSNWYFAEYSTFIVFGETTNYRLNVSGFSGNVARDALRYSNGHMFTTYDRDNDVFTGTGKYNNNCAVYHGGGFWYRSCAFCRVNASRDKFKWEYLPGNEYWLQSSRMWLQCP